MTVCIWCWYTYQLCHDNSNNKFHLNDNLPDPAGPSFEKKIGNETKKPEIIYLIQFIYFLELNNGNRQTTKLY